MVVIATTMLIKFSQCPLAPIDSASVAPGPSPGLTHPGDSRDQGAKAASGHSKLMQCVAPGLIKVAFKLLLSEIIQDDFFSTL